MTEVQRLWGAGIVDGRIVDLEEVWADAEAPSAGHRILTSAVGSEDAVSVQTLRTYHREEEGPSTEPGSHGWRGYTGLAPDHGLVTRASSYVAWSQAIRARIAAETDPVRAAKARAAKARKQVTGVNCTGPIEPLVMASLGDALPVPQAPITWIGMPKQRNRGEGNR